MPQSDSFKMAPVFKTEFLEHKGFPVNEVDEILVPSFSDVHFDFSTKPQETTDESSTLHAVHPLSRSTRRRVGPWKPKKQSTKKKCTVTKSDQNSDPTQIQEDGATAEASTPEESNEQPQSALLSLPGEIRNAIYTHLYRDGRIYIQPQPHSKAFCVIKFDVHLALLSCCRQVNAEARNLFYENVTIIFGTTMVTKSIPAIFPSDILKKVHKLEVMSGPQDFFEDDYLIASQVPALESLVFRVSDTMRIPPATARPNFTTYDENDLHFQNLVSSKRTSIERKVRRDEGASFRWFTNLVKNTDRTFTIVYEEEIGIGTFNYRLGHVVFQGDERSRQPAKALLFRKDVDSNKPAEHRWIRSGEFRVRNEFYLKVVDDSVMMGRALSALSRIRDAHSRAKIMRYHETMMRIEDYPINQNSSPSSRDTRDASWYPVDWQGPDSD